MNFFIEFKDRKGDISDSIEYIWLSLHYIIHMVSTATKKEKNNRHVLIQNIETNIAIVIQYMYMYHSHDIVIDKCTWG